MAENEENHEGDNPGANAGGVAGAAAQPEVISLADHQTALESLRTDLGGQLTAAQTQLETLRTESQAALDAAMGEAAAAVTAYGDFVRQQPGLVPELVTGNSVKEINASIEAAKAAYQAAVSSQGGVGAGGGSRSGGAAGGSGDRPKEFEIGGANAGLDKILQGYSGQGAGGLSR